MGAEHGPCLSPQDHHLADQRPILDEIEVEPDGIFPSSESIGQKPAMTR